MLTNSFFNPPRLKRVAISLLAALIIALVIGYVNDPDSKSLLRRGDFPGFYVLAKIIDQFPASELYNPELQREIENAYWPSFKGNFYMSVYPPYDALLLWPLSWFPPQAAQLLFTFCMFIFLTFSFFIVAKINSSLNENFFSIFVFSLCFAPLFFGIFAAQNTALSMLCYSYAIYFSTFQNKKARFLCGLALGVWLFKPQFGALAIGMGAFTLSGYLLLGASLPAILYYLLGSLVSGFLWPLNWLKSISQFSSQNFVSNGAEMVSLAGSIKALLANLGFTPDSQLIINTSYIINLFVLTGMLCFGLLYMKKFILNKTLKGSNDLLPTYLILIGPLILVSSPQTLFYDLGILLISVYYCLDFRASSTYRHIAWVLPVFAVAVFWRAELIMPPFFLAALLVFYFIVKNKDLIFKRAGNN